MTAILPSDKIESLFSKNKDSQLAELSHGRLIESFIWLSKYFSSLIGEFVNESPVRHKSDPNLSEFSNDREKWNRDRHISYHTGF